MSLLSKAPLLNRLTGLRPPRPRVDIVSESLCDDILERLAPSLGPYIGGTVIDIYPGVGLFSRKLHEYLKPQRHILVEPQWEHYSPYLSPLLEVPQTNFHHRAWSGDKPWDLHNYIEDGLIPKEPESNSSTLQLVNATTSLAKIAAHQKNPVDARAIRFARAARHQAGFHERGPTRMLIWCEDETKFTTLPRDVNLRRKQAILLEAHCHVEEVVGFGGRRVKGARRETSLDMESRGLVRQRMEDNNINTPLHRVEQEVGQASAIGTIPAISRPWHAEFRELERRDKAGELSRYIEEHPAPTSSSPDGRLKQSPVAVLTPEYRRYVRLRGMVRSGNAAYADSKVVADEQAAIDALDLESYSPTLSAAKREKTLQSIDVRTEVLERDFSKLAPNKKKQVNVIIDDTHALHMPPRPLMMWDQRSYEPLTADLSEFHQKKKVALLDFQAKPAGTLPLTEEQADYFEMLGAALFSTQGSHNLKLLDTLAPGAYNALVPRVSELTDAREGGRRHVERLHARTITPKMLWRLAVEWDKWLFKPEKREIAGLYKSIDVTQLAGKRRW